MSPLVAVVLVVAPFGASPPPWLLWGYGYNQPAYSQQLTIPGKVEMPATTMFKIQSRAGERLP